MLTSGKSYDILRESGFISLPSRRTLRDYTHWLKLKPGFDSNVINFLIAEAKIDTLADWQKLINDTKPLLHPCVIFMQVCSISI